MAANKLVWGVIAIAILGILWWAVGPSYEDQAAARVEQMLEVMRQGTGIEQQDAVGLWAKNNPKLMDRDELDWASNHYDKFRQEKDLYRSFTGFRIVDSEMVEGEKVRTAIVSFEVEGQGSYRVRVPERLPMSWED